MSRLNSSNRVKRENWVSPEEASGPHVRRYLNMAVWQTSYIQRAFESDSQEDLARMAKDIHERLLKLRERWNNK